MILRAQIFISTVFAQLSSTQSIRETLYRTKAEPNAGCELTEEHSDAWEAHIANPEA